MKIYNKNENTEVQFEGFDIKRIHMDGTLVENSMLTVDIENKIEFLENESVDVYLDLKINSETENFVLNLCMVGHFKIKEEYVDFLEPNLLAIMFPYLRATVNYLTSIDGKRPIILPPINFNAYVAQRSGKFDV
nr:MAG TPA: Preprotein translocase subunit SecB [Caudoviricetes sp.]